jgi:hypothetical protein
MNEIGPVPPGLMITVFVISGLMVSVIYSIDWGQIF